LEGDRVNRRDVAVFAALVALSLAPAAHAQASDPVGLLQAACSATRSQVLCDLADAAAFAQNLAQNGANRLVATLGNIGQGFVTDAISTLGANTCLGGTCLNDLTGGLKHWLETEPDKFFDELYRQGEQYYLSNFLDRMNNPSSSAVDSPSYAADEAPKVNPNLKAEAVDAAAKDLDAFRNLTEMGKLAAIAKGIVAPPPAGQTDPYRQHVNNILLPSLGGASTLDGFRNQARTAASSREVIQTLVDLEAARAGWDISNTEEVSRRVQQVSSEQAVTNAQLAMIYQALVGQANQKSLEFQAQLEEKLSNAFDDAANAASLFSSAGEAVMDRANPNFVLDFANQF
jgi:hypothetical protein